ncbi:hypothetical protein Mgra_00001320 [Meloidogyne graminicola]|uniref:Uncharacterized protein n=1 Tax=Meloidogyne graminicola TaxID=189291 RepID=A0A8T0A0R8_9BILA|nr:hypothetical protein Mgra_00001320 [Meloidogyne graminicola]
MNQQFQGSFDSQKQYEAWQQYYAQGGQPTQETGQQMQQPMPPIQQHIFPTQQHMLPSQPPLPPVQQHMPPTQQHMLPSQPPLPPVQQHIPPIQQHMLPTQQHMPPPQQPFQQAYLPSIPYGAPQLSMAGQYGAAPTSNSTFFPQPPSGPPQPQKQRLDPEMVPSIIQVVEDDKNSRSGLFPTGFPQAELPPLTTTEFIAQDQGSNFFGFLLKLTKAILIRNLFGQPFTLFRIYSPPLVDLGDIGPVRCQRCKAYMCPFMEFIDGGRKFRCPFCKASTTIQDAYFAHLDHSGRRTDIQHRPELYLGSYEFVATKQYCKNGIPPKQPAFIFMLDVSYNSIRTGLVELFCNNIVEILHDLPRDNFNEKSTMRIGLATYDQSCTLLQFKPP